MRFLRSVFLPEDGSCLLVFGSESDEAVLEACRRAAIVPDRISETLHLNGDGKRHMKPAAADQ